MRRTIELSMRLLATLLMAGLGLAGNPLAPIAVSAQETPSAAKPAAGAEITLLAFGDAIERKLSGGEQRTYRVALTAGQYASVVVEQRGIDVVVRWMGPDGKPIAEFDAESRLQGDEKTELVAEADGAYALTVAARQQKASEGVYAIRFAELRAASETDRSLQEARRLSTESGRLIRAAKFADALTVAQRGLEIREKTLGADDPAVAQSLNSLGVIRSQTGDYAGAEPLHRRALEIRERALGPDHPDVASSLNNLASLDYYKGDFVHAETLYRRALEIKERALGPDHLDVAPSLNGLANIGFVRGDYVSAEQFGRRALDIKERALGPEHSDVASSLNNLGAVLDLKGDFAGAEQLYQRSLAIKTKALGPDHVDVAFILNNLGVVSLKKGDFASAEQFSRRALEIREKALGPNHATVGQSLGNLGNVYSQSGAFDKAEPLIERALAIRERALGPDHIDVASSLTLLAGVRTHRGDFLGAEPLYRRAIAIREKALGPEQPDLAETLNGLATLYAAKGDISQAIATQSRANGIIERNLALNLVAGSERQKLAYLASLSAMTDRTLSLHLRGAPDNVVAQELAAAAILQRKGRVLDALSDSVTALRQRLNAQDQTLLDRLRETTAQLAGLVLSGPQRITLDEHQKRIRALEAQRETLENEVSHLSAGFYERAAPVSLAAVRAAIPPTAALIEFAAYRPFDPATGDGRQAYGDPRYVAYVLRREGRIQWKDLGDARTIDAAVAALRAAARDPKRDDVQRLARAVDERVMQPVRAFLGDVGLLLVSPDGALNLMPFEALVDEQGRYLVERYSFSYLASGRDLLRLQVARPSPTNPLVIVDPSFGDPGPTATAARADARKPVVNDVSRRRGVTTASDLADVYFLPLKSTAQEGRAIKALFPDATVMAGAQATEASLKQAAAPRILHIATHGFFLSDVPAPTDTAGTRAISATVRIENPLLRSGLALKGANVRKSGDEDGILTALEATGLNLWGTKLVVLSACDTGVGEVKNGEGVYGLRRAFVLAGTETLVMSLWPVSDYVTRELMTSYYTGLTKGQGRGEALRQAQLGMLQRKDRQHPFYWASFIQSGEWANLNGTR